MEKCNFKKGVLFHVSVLRRTKSMKPRSKSAFSCDVARCVRTTENKDENEA